MHAQRAQVKNQKERSLLSVMNWRPIPNSVRAPGESEYCDQSYFGSVNSTGTTATIRTSGKVDVVEVEVAGFPVTQPSRHVAHLVDAGAVDGGTVAQQSRMDEQQGGG
jgi:hypothetical protein